MGHDLPELYRASMRRHRFGYALYEPAPSSRLRPGMLGYLDEYRRWHPILDLTDSAAVEAAGYTPIGQLKRSKPDVRSYGPLTSDNVMETSIQLEGGVDASGLGLPAEVGGVLQYSSTSNFGAVLMCDGDVVSEGFDFREPFLTWLKRNARALFAAYPDLKKHGACATTWTYSSTKIHINAWEGSNNNVTVGFNLAAPGIGHAGPQTTWIRGHTSSGWSAWTDQPRVVFFTGVKVSIGLLGTREKHEKHWRGADDTFIVEGSDEEERYEAEVELFGDDWHKIRCS